MHAHKHGMSPVNVTWWEGGGGPGGARMLAETKVLCLHVEEPGTDVLGKLLAISIYIHREASE